MLRKLSSTLTNRHALLVLVLVLKGTPLRFRDMTVLKIIFKITVPLDVGLDNYVHAKFQVIHPDTNWKAQIRQRVAKKNKILNLFPSIFLNYYWHIYMFKMPQPVYIKNWNFMFLLPLDLSRVPLRTMFIVMMHVCLCITIFQNLSWVSLTSQHCFTGVHSIRTSVHRLENLDPEIISSVISISRSRHEKNVMRHLKLLMKEWTFELTNLIKVMDEMTDPKMFMLVSGENSFV
jgi:hypothetical protein